MNNHADRRFTGVTSAGCIGILIAAALIAPEFARAGDGDPEAACGQFVNVAEATDPGDIDWYHAVAGSTLAYPNHRQNEWGEQIPAGGETQQYRGVLHPQWTFGTTAGQHDTQGCPGNG